MKKHWLFSGAFLFVLACAAAGALNRANSITIEARNHNWNAATVYPMCHGRQLARIGPIDTEQKAVELVPIGSCRNIYFRVHFLAAGWYTTYSVMVAPDDYVLVVIENSPQHSSVRKAGGQR